MNSTVKNWQNSSKVFHQRADEYDDWFDNSLLFDIETTAVRALSIPIQSPALEIGVGPGRFAKALNSGFGIDPAFAPLKISQSRGIVTCQAVGEALPYYNNSFARVSIFFTLCFVQNPAEVLRESYRVLSGNGYLLLGFVPATGQWGLSLQQKKESGHPFYEHAQFFSIKEIETLLAEQGFSLVASVSSLYQAPGEVQQMESPQEGADKEAGFIVIAATKDQTP